MKNHLLISLVIFLAIQTTIAQQSFEGVIKFSTEISITDMAPEGAEQWLKNQYGDSLLMYYSQNGHFRRIYLNGGDDGFGSQIYFADKGKIYLTDKNNVILDSLNTEENSLRLASKTKLPNEQIMGLDCECYEIKAVAELYETIILHYCYSFESPEINPYLFAGHRDFFLNEFYQLAKRPYLKFKLLTNDFSLTYTATELMEIEIDERIFNRILDDASGY